MIETKLELFKALLAAESSPNLQAAALKIQVSQPTISRQLKELELDLGVPLFVESGRRKLLSPLAKDLCQRLRAGFDNLENEISQWKMQSRDFSDCTLRLGGRTTLAAHLMLMAPERPKLVAIEMQSARVVDALINQVIEIGIVSELPPRSEFISKKILAETMVVAAHPKICPANTQKDLCELLQNHPTLAFREDLGQLTDLLKHYQIERSRLKVARVIADWRTLVSCAEAGMGWVLTPKHFIDEKTSKLKTFEISNSIVESATFHLIVRKELKQLKGFQEWFRSI